MLILLARATALAERFTSGALRAIDFESELLALGFDSVTFSPPSAKYLGVRYELT